MRRQTDVLTLKHESRILGQLSNPISGARKSQTSSPWSKQQSITGFIMEKPHTGLDECPRILLSCFRARNSADRVSFFRPSVRPTPKSHVILQIRREEEEIRIRKNGVRGGRGRENNISAVSGGVMRMETLEKWEI